MPPAAHAASGNATSSAISPDQSASRPSTLQRLAFLLCSTMQAKDQLHHHCLKQQQKHKQRQQLGEDFRVN